MDHRGVVIRRDSDNPRAVVARLCNVVIVWDVGVGRIAAPNQDGIGVKPVFRRVGKHNLPDSNSGPLVTITDLHVLARKGRTQSLEEGVRSAALASQAVDPSAATLNNRLRPISGHSIDDRVSDLRQGLIPTHALPASLATSTNALERVLDPCGVIHAVNIAGAFLTTPGIGIRNCGIVRRRVVAHLLLSQHDSVFDEEVEVASFLIPAIGQVGRLYDLVPAPLFLPQCL